MKCSECLVQTMCDELNCDYFLERIGLERVMDDAVVFKVNINEMNDYPKYISKKIHDYISEKKIPDDNNITEFEIYMCVKSGGFGIGVIGHT